MAAADLSGKVVAVESYYDDGQTDYYAYVWNEKSLSVESAGPCSYGTAVDGPAWVAAFYALAKAIEKSAREAANRAARLKREEEDEACRVSYGKEVKVVRGRKVPKGTVGRVFWVGESKFGRRVGLELASGAREFTAVCNVEVIGCLMGALINKGGE